LASSLYLLDGAFHLFLLVSLCVVAVLTAKRYGPRIVRVREFLVRPFAGAWNEPETRGLQISNEFTEFSWHASNPL
jgi:hypothetical protein